MSISRRTLGGTDIEVSPIGLGVMQFSGTQAGFGVMFERLSQEQMNGIVQAALDGGITWFDTAELYGFGRSERGLSSGLKAAGVADDEVVVATKWFPVLRTAGSIRRTIHNRLRHLQGFTIDLYMVHQPWGLSSPEAEMEAMADLVEQGAIRSVGVSNFSAERMRRAHRALEKRGLTLAVNQVQYSLLHREIESNGVLETAKELGVTIVAWSPLAQGLLSGKFHKDPARIRQAPLGRQLMLRRRIEQTRPLVEALEAIAAAYDATPVQVALNWLIHYAGDAVVAIPGASRARQAADSAGAMQFKLSEADLARLGELTRSWG